MEEVRSRRESGSLGRTESLCLLSPSLCGKAIKSINSTSKTLLLPISGSCENDESIYRFVCCLFWTVDIFVFGDSCVGRCLYTAVVVDLNRFKPSIPPVAKLREIDTTPPG